MASADWLFELDLQMSRSFRALKVWMALKSRAAKFGRLIDQNMSRRAIWRSWWIIVPAAYMVTINIVCFRYEAEGLDEPR